MYVLLETFQPDLLTEVLEIGMAKTSWISWKCF